MSLVWARELEVIVTLSCTRLALRKKRVFSRWTGRWIERFFISIHDRIVVCDYVSYGGFLKWGVPINSWMVYSGEFLLKWMITRNLGIPLIFHKPPYGLLNNHLLLKLLALVFSMTHSDMMRSLSSGQTSKVIVSRSSKVFFNYNIHNVSETCIMYIPSGNLT